MFEERENCPVCGSSDHKLLHEALLDKPPISDYLTRIYSRVGPGIQLELLKDVNYTLLECADCTLIFQKYIPNDELMLILYEKWIDPETTRTNHLRTDDVNLFNYYANEMSVILALLDKSPNDTHILDFGMGWAKWALMAKAFGTNCKGAELSQARLENAKNLGIDTVHWDDIPGGSFDFINTEQVFEHISTPTETLMHLRAGLSDSGLIKISVPTDNKIHKKIEVMDWSASRLSKHDLNAVSPLEHINLFNYASLATLADQCGLRIRPIPISTQYRFSTNWKGLKQIGKNVVLPFYRNVMKKQNYVFMELKS